MTNESRQDVIRKGSSIISATPNDSVMFEPIDNTLFNYLVLRTYSDISPEQQIYRVPVKEVMEYLRIDRIGKLQASLERLGKGFIEIDYVDAETGEPRSMYAHYLSSDVSSTGSGMLKFAFDPILVHFLSEPKVFGLISVSRVRDLKTVASQKLYEMMALQFRKKTPEWRCSVEELRAYFQAGDKNARFDNFRIHVIEKAIADVNAIAEFDIVVDYIRGGKGGGVTEIVFKALSKSHTRLIEASAIKSPSTRKKKPTDSHTIDLLDGKTFEERGGPAELTMAAIESARDMIPDDADINHLITEWRDINRGRALTNPDQSFLSWLELKLSQENDPLLKDIDGDVFGLLVGGRD